MNLTLPNPNLPYINIITMDKEGATMDKQSTEALIEDLKIGGMDCVCKRKVRKISPKDRSTNWTNGWFGGKKTYKRKKSGKGKRKSSKKHI